MEQIRLSYPGPPPTWIAAPMPAATSPTARSTRCSGVVAPSAVGPADRDCSFISATNTVSGGVHLDGDRPLAVGWPWTSKVN